MARTLVSGGRVELPPIKNSRFIATAVPVGSESDAKAALAEITAEMPNAGHHCAAWRIAEPAEHAVLVAQVEYGATVRRRVAIPIDPGAEATIARALTEATNGRVRLGPD